MGENIFNIYSLIRRSWVRFAEFWLLIELLERVGLTEPREWCIADSHLLFVLFAFMLASMVWDLVDVSIRP